MRLISYGRFRHLFMLRSLLFFTAILRHAEVNVEHLP
ncbi:hypothetical protein T05_13766 [Trichinella murrelli]|uniref:Uncharacterized protein n=1 Tax=Trichinella murrelli TaxID=144512 RepID=A0A0V0TZ45_9BILA|nr:hypothetical protein T05_13766 [Trichinella murrelli]